MKLENVLELRKAKYTKRTGSPGNYKYFYGTKTTGSRNLPVNAAEKLGGTHFDVTKKTDRASFTAKYKGAGGRKQLITDVIKELNDKMPAIETGEIKAGTVSNYNMIDILLDMKNKKKVKTGSKKLANKMTTKLKTNIVKRNENVKTVQTLPQNVSELTVDSVTFLIKQTVKLLSKKIRENQDLVSYQKQKAYKEKNAKAFRRLEVMENIYQAAMDIKEFRHTSANSWAKDIVGKIKDLVNAEK